MATTTDQSPTAVAAAALAGVVEGYQELRERVYEAAIANSGELMGQDAWLRSSLSERDMELSITDAGVHCHGRTYTAQTWDHEDFDFFVPFSALLPAVSQA